MNRLKSIIVYVVYMLSMVIPMMLVSSFLGSRGLDQWGRIVAIFFVGFAISATYNSFGFTRRTLTSMLGWNKKEEENK